MAGEGDARSSAELAVKHVSWSKVFAVGRSPIPAPALPDWRPVAFSAGGDGGGKTPELFL